MSGVGEAVAQPCASWSSALTLAVDIQIVSLLYVTLYISDVRTFLYQFHSSQK